MSLNREATYQNQVASMLKKVESGTVLNPVATVECRSCNKIFSTQNANEQLVFLYQHPGHVIFVYPKGKANSPQALV